MSAVAGPSRLRALTQLRCGIFQTTYNPQCLRTGAKYLRARLRGPSLVGYYPEKIDFAQIIRQNPTLNLVDDDEEERVQDALERRRRGKGPPKKTKTKEESRRLTKRR